MWQVSAQSLVLASLACAFLIVMAIQQTSILLASLFSKNRNWLLEIEFLHAPPLNEVDFLAPPQGASQQAPAGERSGGESQAAPERASAAASTEAGRQGEVTEGLPWAD